MRNTLINEVLTEQISLSIPILDNDCQVVGSLIPITPKSISTYNLVNKLTKWRNQSKKAFLTQFIATEDRTQNWLKTVVLSSSNSLLFLIVVNGIPIGHYGFKNLNNVACELDNLVRGESGGPAELILFSEIALVQWLFKSFLLDHIYCHVFEKNIFALDLHKRIGFEISERIPLKKSIVSETEISFDFAETTEHAEQFLLKLILKYKH